jgi:hypothetical protein
MPTVEGSGEWTLSCPHPSPENFLNFSLEMVRFGAICCSLQHVFDMRYHVDNSFVIWDACAFYRVYTQSNYKNINI